MITGRGASKDTGEPLQSIAWMELPPLTVNDSPLTTHKEIPLAGLEPAARSLGVFGVESQSTLLRCYVETNDSALVVEDLTVHYKPKRPSFWQRHWLKLGIVAGIATYVFLK